MYKYIWNGICNVTSPNEDKINRLFKNVQKKKYIIFPCCTGINKTVGHWFLIIYSKEKQWILDSMENSDKIESIVYFISTVNTCLYQDSSVNVVEVTNLPKQKNHVDCGLFMLYYIQLFIETGSITEMKKKAEISFTDETIQNLRKEILDKIIYKNN